MKKKLVQYIEKQLNQRAKTVTSTVITAAATTIINTAEK